MTYLILISKNNSKNFLTFCQFWRSKVNLFLHIWRLKAVILCYFLLPQTLGGSTALSHLFSAIISSSQKRKCLNFRQVLPLLQWNQNLPLVLTAPTPSLCGHSRSHLGRQKSPFWLISMLNHRKPMPRILFKRPLLLCCPTQLLQGTIYYHLCPHRLCPL